MPDSLPAKQPQPTSRMCFVCGRENPVGLHLRFLEDRVQGRVTACVKIPDAYQGYPGIAHGGIVAAILDEVSGRAIMVDADETPFWVTAKLEIRYREPTPTETPLEAVGWVTERRRRSAQVAGELRREDGTVTAEISAVVVKPSAAQLEAWGQWSQEATYWLVEEKESL